MFSRPTHFKDATDLILEGTADLEPGQLVHHPRFTLMDAMNAIEIMDPRMDSGVALPQTSTPPPTFDPLEPLLPSEICWILDRAFACEMAYHTGLTLSQTAYTVLHLLPENLASLHKGVPNALMGIVFRAGLIGTAKCLGLVWEELSRGNLYDGEDYNGDRFGLSLCDHVSVKEAEELLREALEWLDEVEGEVEEPFRSALHLRLSFRLTFLLTLFSATADSLLTLRGQLSLLHRSHLDLTTKPVPQAVDPAINRKLVSHAPLSTIEIGSAADAVATLELLVEGMEGVWDLSVRDGKRESVLDILEFLELRSCSHSSPQPLAYVRSLTMSLLYDPSTSLILNAYPLRWLSDTYLRETALLPPGTLRAIVECAEDDLPRPWGNGTSGPTLSEAVNVFEQRIAGFLVNTLSNSCQNRARQKRLTAKAISQWEELFDEASDLIPLSIERLSSSPTATVAQVAALASVPLALSLHRISLVQTTLFAGFDLSLYTSTAEHAFLYWVAARSYAVEAALLGSALRRMMVATGGQYGWDGTKEDREVLGRWVQRGKRAEAMEAVCRARFFSTILAANLPPATEQARFLLRLKWLRRSSTSTSNDPSDPVASGRFAPIWAEFDREKRAVLAQLDSAERDEVVAGLYAQAQTALAHVGVSRSTKGRAEANKPSPILRLKHEWEQRVLDAVLGEGEGHHWFP